MLSQCLVGVIAYNASQRKKSNKKNNSGPRSHFSQSLRPVKFGYPRDKQFWDNVQKTACVCALPALPEGTAAHRTQHWGDVYGRVRAQGTDCALCGLNIVDID